MLNLTWEGGHGIAPLPPPVSPQPIQGEGDPKRGARFRSYIREPKKKFPGKISGKKLTIKTNIYE